MSSLPTASRINNCIVTVRGQKVILDADLAEFYGIPVKRLNEQLSRNLNKFPADFAFQLSFVEWATLRSQLAAAQTQATESQKHQPNWSQFATSSKLRRGAAYRPWAFTEHGALQAANVLNSPHAAAMSVYVIRAFIKMREDLAANAAILKRLAEIDRTLLQHDTALHDIYQKLRPLLLPPEPKRREIGFHAIGRGASDAGKAKSHRKYI